MSDGRLAGKVALVTGAGSGIGEAISKRFAAEGARVYVTDISEAGAGRVARDISDAGGQAVPRRLDVIDSRAVNDAVSTIVADEERLDILVANAALTGESAYIGPVTEVTDEQWNHVIAVNLSGVFFCARAAAKVMLQQQHGCIITLGSVNSFVPKSDVTAYAAAKGGVLLLTRSLARDLGRFGIRVNGIAPGSINTPKVLSARQSAGEAGSDRFARLPLGRTGEPGEIAAVAAFLASDDASYIHGEMIVVDGGHLCT